MIIRVLSSSQLTEKVFHLIRLPLASGIFLDALRVRGVVQPKGCQVIIRGANDYLREVFSMTGFSKLFIIE